MMKLSYDQEVFLLELFNLQIWNIHCKVLRDTYYVWGQRFLMHQSFVSPDPIGLGIAGTYWGLRVPCFELSIVPAVHWNCEALDSMPKPEWFHILIYLPELEHGFWQDFGAKMSLQCWAYTWALRREKSKSSLFTSPVGAVVTNDWLYTPTNIFIYNQSRLLFKKEDKSNMTRVV